MEIQTIADGTAALISLIALATLAALWLLSWAFHRLRIVLERRDREAAAKEETFAERWKRIESEVAAQMREHARQREEWRRANDLEPAIDTQDQPQSKVYKPHAYYNSDGDMIECWLADDMSYGEQITPGITVMRSQETDEIVGVQIHGVQRMLEQEFRPVQDNESSREPPVGPITADTDQARTCEQMAAELETLIADYRQRQASGDRWEEYTGDGR